MNFTAPKDTLVISPTVKTKDDGLWKAIPKLVCDLKGERKRDWFNAHAYRCLPLVIGNQFGWGIRSMYTFECEWNGGGNPDDVKLYIEETDETGIQKLSAHFGMGLVTVQNHVLFHTPPEINLVTSNAPNTFIDGIFNMTGVIEGDNLQRDFTFNLRITRPNYRIRIEKGDIISGLYVTPRRFVSDYTTVLGNRVFGEDYYNHMLDVSKEFGRQREEDDVEKPAGAGRKYWKGQYADGCPFHNSHMTNVKKTKNDLDEIQ